ncbi:MAG: phosphatase PAP2 family protein [Solirubrobacterales bacterium]
MATNDFTRVARDGDVPLLGFAHWEWVRRGALVAYFAALVLWSAENGIPVQRELVILWTVGALVCVSLGRPLRQIGQLAVDWLPIVAILLAYDFTRGAADTIGIPVHEKPMIEFDQFLFGGTTPTEWLQAQIHQPGVVNWWDVAFTIVYTSYFIVPFVLAGYLWARDHPAFKRFVRRLVTLALAGLATYILFPAAPPWLASQHGLLDGVQRTTAEGWQVLGVGTAALFSKGQGVSNPVAAVPSLHTAFVTLVAFFLWGRVRPVFRPLLVLYPLAMGLTLMATGEHYFFDVVLGWLYAGAVMVGWASWEGWRDRPEAEARRRVEARERLCQLSSG